VVWERWVSAEERQVVVLLRRSERSVGGVVLVRWVRCGKAMVVIRGVVQGPAAEDG
jgi:hypothetical protein